VTSESAPALVKRPGIITFIAWLLIIKSAMAAVTAIFAFFGFFTENTGLSDSQLLTAGVVEAGVAIILLWAGNNLLTGNKSARTFVGVVVGIRLVATVVVMLTHHSGGYLSVTLLGAAIGLIALWALYANQASVDYFEGTAS